MHEDVLAYCERNDIPSIPFWPLHGGAPAQSEAMAELESRVGATPAEVAIAWLLQKSVSIILIPGTSSITHLEQNVGACDIRLSDADMELLEQLSIPAIR
jgi:pyridoxine 4-dehydrogenase